MIGGYILQITEKTPGVSQIWVQGTGCEQHDERAVDVKTAAVMPKPGDSCWWQGRNCYCANDTITLRRMKSRLLLKGGIIGVAEIVDCVEASASPWFFGRYGFVLRNARPVEFIPVKGAVGFFDWRKQLTGGAA